VFGLGSALAAGPSARPTLSSAQLNSAQLWIEIKVPHERWSILRPQLQANRRTFERLYRPGNEMEE
jgi:Holliday junction resolvase